MQRFQVVYHDIGSIDTQSMCCTMGNYSQKLHVSSYKYLTNADFF